MIHYLRKHKLEKLLFSQPQTYLILQLLPVKECYFLEWVNALAKYNIQVKFLKTKQSGGLLRSISPQTHELCLKTIFNGNSVYLQPEPSFKGSFFKQYFRFVKEKSSLFIQLKSQYVITHVYDEGVFYHVDEILQTENQTQFEVPTNFAHQIQNPIEYTLSQISQPGFQIAFLMDSYISQCQLSIKSQK